VDSLGELPISALDIAARLRRREISSLEITRHYLATLARRNDALGAFVEVHEWRALRAARRADVLLGRRAGPWPVFLGLPTGIKDHEHLRGHATRVGSRALSWLSSPVDGHVARACRRGGLHFFGKLATSELTILPFVHTDLHRPARNPWNEDHYCGGSSGGSASAVAAGMLPLAPGSDGAGSIRIPSSFCGLVGMKPSRGMLAHPYGPFDYAQISAQGPIARTVRDAAALLDVLAGRPTQETLAASESFSRAATSPPEALRIRVLTETPLARVDEEIVSRVLLAARRLEELGHHVEEGRPLVGEVDEFLPLMSNMAALVPLLPFTERLLQPTTRWMRAHGRGIRRRDGLLAKRTLEARIEAWFGDADVWITPTVPMLAPRVGSFDGMTGEQIFRAAAPLGAFTTAYNVSGQPALSLPAGTSTSGLPIGLQIAGRRGADRLVLALAAQLENALGEAEAPGARPSG
jgi:amidase